MWLTAESPVLNAGTTNANWLCYAKTCSGNGTQKILIKQPVRTTYLGRSALEFSGTNAMHIVAPPTNNLGGNTARFFVRFATTNKVSAGTLIARGDINATYVSFENAGIVINSNGFVTARVGFISGGYRATPVATNVCNDGNWHTAEAWCDGTNTFLSVDNGASVSTNYAFASGIAYDNTYIGLKPHLDSIIFPFFGWVNEVRIGDK
jgi:hypothetical protein